MTNPNRKGCRPNSSLRLPVIRLTVRVLTVGARILTFRISYMSAAADTDGSGFKSQGAHHQTSLFSITPSGQASWDRNSILLG